MASVTFQIEYYTTPGERLYVVGTTPQIGAGATHKAVALDNDGKGHNTATVEFPADITDFGYRYFVQKADGSKRKEWGRNRLVKLQPGVGTYLLSDKWQDLPDDKPFYSSAFRKAIFHREPRKKAVRRGLVTPSVTLTITAPEIPSHLAIALCGEGPELGGWNPRKALMLDDTAFPKWSITLPTKDIVGKDFKFIVLNPRTKAVIAWEKGANRHIFGEAEVKMTVYSGLSADFGLPRWRGTGCAIPVFSLRSEEDYGCGDFLDLMPMADRMAKTGQSILQILPVNDTICSGTNRDSYPYSAVSSFALHPMYLRPDEAGQLKSKARRDYFRRKGDRLNSLSAVDYENAVALKLQYIKELYEQDYAGLKKTPDFKSWVEASRGWLLPYAAFKILRDIKGTPIFDEWGAEGIYSEALAERITEENEYAAGLIYYTQYHLARQLKKARDYARERGVVLKGDLPIGVSRYSADAWSNPRLFNLDCQAGAPPDDFAREGQNWGFPTYNWPVMAADGFSWWKNRLRLMSQYFDAFRIDHLLGFFRIWTIPAGAIHGLLGVFDPAIPFTQAELREKYGFCFNPELHLQPYITDEVLDAKFGKSADDVRHLFLVRDGARYRFIDEIGCQRDVEGAVKRHVSGSMKAQTIISGLIDLFDNVLFIADRHERGKIHPRICGERTPGFAALAPDQQESYRRLSEDYFYHRQNDLWRESAMSKLPPLLDATTMLACGEDLGMIPLCVPEVMKELRILSLEVPRMPKEMAEFGDTGSYPYYSVCSPSTHDMPGIRLWWEENYERAQRYYNGPMGLEGKAPRQATPDICRRMIRLCLDSPSMLCIIPLQDLLSVSAKLRRENADEEVINVPSDPNHYWRYRMHLSISELAGLKEGARG